MILFRLVLGLVTIRFPVAVAVAIPLTVAVAMPVQFLGILPRVAITRNASHNQSGGSKQNKKADR